MYRLHGTACGDFLQDSGGAMTVEEVSGKIGKIAALVDQARDSLPVCSPTSLTPRSPRLPKVLELRLDSPAGTV